VVVQAEGGVVLGLTGGLIAWDAAGLPLDPQDGFVELD